MKLSTILERLSKTNKTKQNEQPSSKTQPRTTFTCVPYVGNQKGGKNLRWQQMYGNMNGYWPIWFTQGPRKSRNLMFAEIRLLVHPVVLWSSFHETFFPLVYLNKKDINVWILWKKFVLLASTLRIFGISISTKCNTPTRTKLFY